MRRLLRVSIAIIIALLSIGGYAFAADTEILGVKFPGEKAIAGKTLTLNGVAMRKAMVVVKVYASGLYLEKPTHDGQEAIESEQIKHLHFHYLTNKATADKLREGFIAAMEKANPPELVEKHREKIDRFGNWLGVDLKPGDTTETTYVPGDGLSVWVKGEKKGTFKDIEFIQMYYRYNLGEKADAKRRKGYLGIK